MHRHYMTLFRVGGIVAAFLLGMAYVIGSLSMVSKTENLLDSGVSQVDPSITASADTLIAFIGSVLVRRYGEPSAATRDSITKDMRGLCVDEINVVDSNGYFVCSTDSAVRDGDDFQPGLKTRTVDYSLLLKGTSCLVEQVRGSVEHPELRRKYGGVAFPYGNGFVQVGLNERRLITDFEHFYEQLAVGWRFGESGHYILADPATGVIVSAFRASDRGKTLMQAVPDLVFADRGDGRTKRLAVWGEPCFVRDMTYLGHRVLAVLPEREASSSRILIVGVTGVLLLVVFGAIAFMIGRVIEKERQERRREEEDRQKAARDMRMARNIQLNVLPAVFPPYPQLADRIDIYATMRTAKEVGGDFYDFYLIGSDRLAVLVADVSGKGVPAALFMMRAKTSIHGLLRSGGDVGEVMSEVNDRLSRGNDANMFVTVWVAIVDLRTGRCEYVNAGHNPPLLKRSDGTVSQISSLSGPPLASFGGLKYRKHELTLSSGEGIYLYTDGVTEAVNRTFEQYGEERLRKVVCTFLKRSDSPAARSSSALCAEVIGDIDRFSAGAEQADDITMLALLLKRCVRFPSEGGCDFLR